MATYHIKFRNLKPNLTTEELAAVTATSWVLNKADKTDWPVTFDWQGLKWLPKDNFLVCNKCGGYIYRRARLTVDHMIGLIKAFGAPLHIKQILSEETCTRKNYV